MTSWQCFHGVHFGKHTLRKIMWLFQLGPQLWNPSSSANLGYPRDKTMWYCVVLIWTVLRTIEFGINPRGLNRPGSMICPLQLPWPKLASPESISTTSMPVLASSRAYPFLCPLNSLWSWEAAEAARLTASIGLPLLQFFTLRKSAALYPSHFDQYHIDSFPTWFIDNHSIWPKSSGTFCLPIPPTFLWANQSKKYYMSNYFIFRSEQWLGWLSWPHPYQWLKRNYVKVK